MAIEPISRREPKRVVRSNTPITRTAYDQSYQATAFFPPPIDALQYERLALAAFHLCERQGQQLQHLITLATSLFRNPLTPEERHDQRNLLEVMIHIGEDYRRMNNCDHELFTVLALDAKGIPDRRLTPRDAADLLADAAQSVQDRLATPGTTTTKH
ncbi:hypothetical protein SAMN05445850_6038 [Paraburkholderia tuberum]|uniref:Uncharacterized protein n=1 Tax=Paraburkholderia tuberum TaxID=157910 RepID=A0A1H1JYX5_9BURK|nr:hypothetical protein SAMN05445850_6038 [Paraburkholderia tuberum]